MLVNNSLFKVKCDIRKMTVVKARYSIGKIIAESASLFSSSERADWNIDDKSIKVKNNVTIINLFYIYINKSIFHDDIF